MLSDSLPFFSRNLCILAGVHVVPVIRRSRALQKIKPISSPAVDEIASRHVPSSFRLREIGAGTLYVGNGSRVGTFDHMHVYDYGSRLSDNTSQFEFFIQTSFAPGRLAHRRTSQ